MKNYILSPLCSALVVPGLGQVLNKNLKKGMILLLATFILFVAVVVKLAFVIKAATPGTGNPPQGMESTSGGLGQGDVLFLGVLSLLFASLWIYSVVDALVTGIRMERKAGGECDPT